MPVMVTGPAAWSDFAREMYCLERLRARYPQLHIVTSGKAYLTPNWRRWPGYS
jgi:hypothetical protein